MAPVVKCPVCKAPVPWTDASRFRPFCSERCRTTDLGDWASGRHVIAGDVQADDVPPSDATPPADRAG